MPLTSRKIVHTSYTITDVESGKTLELEHAPFMEGSSGTQPIIKELESGKTVVGYLSHDEDCENPFDSCEGMGKIIDRRSRHSTAESRAEFYKAFGVDEDGNKNGKRNPLAVMLDVYEHSGTSWSIQGGGMQCQWDTTKGGGVWIPDPACLEHIRYEAKKRLMPEGTKVEYKSKTNPDGTCITRKPKDGEKPYFADGTCIDERYSNVITWTLPDGRSHGGYKSFDSAIKAAMKVAFPDAISFDPVALRETEKIIAMECAKNAVETYNSWLSGDCWGYCVEVFDKDGDKISDDACWGVINADEAMKILKDEFESHVRGILKDEEKQRLDEQDKAADELFNA